MKRALFRLAPVAFAVRVFGQEAQQPATSGSTPLLPDSYLAVIVATMFLVGTARLIWMVRGSRRKKRFRKNW
jgi:hypothetical protein